MSWILKKYRSIQRLAGSSEDAELRKKTLILILSPSVDSSRAVLCVSDCLRLISSSSTQNTDATVYTTHPSQILSRCKEPAQYDVGSRM